MASPSTIHDVKYLLAGLRVLSRQDETVNRESVEESIRLEVERYVKEKNLTFGLPERGYVYKHVPSLILRDLSVFKMVDIKKSNVRLTSFGKLTTEFLGRGEILKVYDILTACHLDYFTEFRSFIEITSIRKDRKIKVANPNISGFSQFVEDKGMPFVVDEFLRSLEKEISQLEESPKFKTDLSANIVSLREKLQQFDGIYFSSKLRDKIYRTIENDIERFFVLFYFFPFIQTRTRYDIVRDRLTDLGLVNVILRKKHWITEETVYCLAVPAARYNEHSFPTRDIKEIGNEFRIYVHWPKYENSKQEFAEILRKAINIADTGIGFADIPTVREIVCEKLLLPSPLFDSFLRKCVKDKDLVIDFALATEKVTATRLPIMLAPGKAYNLLRIRKEP
jgi:hypothetical protein